MLDWTATVVTVNEAKVWPAGTLTIPGAVAVELLVASVTVTPPAGAGELRKTVPVALVPPGTLVGLTETDCKSGGAFGSGARLMKNDLVTPPAVAIMFADAASVTGAVAIVKLLALFPAATVTVGGTWAAALSLISATEAPPAGAGMTSWTVPVSESPPITDDGFMPTAKSVAMPAGLGSISSN